MYWRCTIPSRGWCVGVDRLARYLYGRNQCLACSCVRGQHFIGLFKVVRARRTVCTFHEGVPSGPSVNFRSPQVADDCLRRSIDISGRKHILSICLGNLRPPSPHPPDRHQTYMQSRNYMVRSYQRMLDADRDGEGYLTATECRRKLAGDACSILR